MTKNSKKGFTLIELLIVVAIIAILAAIALPNFLEAQTRAKTSRVHAELRTLATALESYRVDFNHYPPWMDGGMNHIHPTSLRLIPLTTPIAYLTAVPRKDPFSAKNEPEKYDTYDYVDAESFARAADPEPSYYSRGADWRINSSGPDLVNSYGGPSSITGTDNPGLDYDPTNGTVSKGDIVRVGPRSNHAGNFLYPNRVE